MKQRIVKIYSDGYPAKTHVLTDDNREIEGVTSIYWIMDINSIAQVDISLIGVIAADLEANVRSIDFQCPCCAFTLSHSCDQQ